MSVIWGGDSFTLVATPPNIFNTTTPLFNRRIFNPAVGFGSLFNTSTPLFNRDIFNPTTQEVRSKFTSLAGGSILLKGLVT